MVQPAPLPPPSDVEKLELFFACRCLISLDVMSQSDPFVEFYLGNQSGQFALVGKTEVIKDNANPNFMKSFEIDYYFERKQPCKFICFDWDDDGVHEYIGEVETTIGQIAGSKGMKFIGDLINTKYKKVNGKIVITADRVKSTNEVYFMKWRGEKLMNVDGWFDKSDPFLRFFRINPVDKSWLLAHETEVIMDNLNPKWQPMKIKAAKLDKGLKENPFKIECWDWEKSGKPQWIGETLASIADIQKEKNKFELYNAKKKKKAGTLIIDSLELRREPTFLEYLKGGLQLNLIVAVDFTGSNGDPQTPTSLHAMKPGVWNEYQQAIMGIGEIVMNYDSDKLIPLFGFGAQLKFPMMNTFGKVSHCFPLTGNPGNASVQGIEGVLQAYTNSLPFLNFSGPTLFNPLFKEAIQAAATCKQAGSDCYTILLIMTDGEIHDMEDTINSLVLASELPLSVLIVGVGGENFKNMEILDGDAGLINSSGQKVKRDLVQFTPFRKFGGNRELLCQDLLSELPKQVLEYMCMINKPPNPPVIVQSVYKPS